ncbi:GOLDEN2-like 2 [Perilla frutescens var. hirtella]|nr:GOLDEN2-like 2 [Perilla frutescens var. hirtella]
MEGFTIDESEFPDFSSGNLLDNIDFDDLFLGISDGDVLSDLEMDPEILDNILICRERIGRACSDEEGGAENDGGGGRVLISIYVVQRVKIVVH